MRCIFLQPNNTVIFRFPIGTKCNVKNTKRMLDNVAGSGGDLEAKFGPSRADAIRKSYVSHVKLMMKKCLFYRIQEIECMYDELWFPEIHIRRALADDACSVIEQKCAKPCDPPCDCEWDCPGKKVKKCSTLGCRRFMEKMNDEGYGLEEAEGQFKKIHNGREGDWTFLKYKGIDRLRTKKHITLFLYIDYKFYGVGDML